MGTFVTSNTALPVDKTDRYAPTGVSYEVPAAYVNSIWAALGDLRDHTFFGWVNPKSSAYGAKMDGSTNDATAIGLAAADATAKGWGLIIPGKIRLSSGTTTINCPVSFGPGGSFDLQTGSTLVINGPITADLHKIFYMNGGTLTVSPKKNRVGYPEWWGAVTNAGDAGNGALNDAALLACVQAVPVTQLQRADYWINSTWTPRREGYTVEGVDGTAGTGGSNGLTRILVRSPTLDTMDISPASAPVDINHFYKNITIRNVELTRDTSSSAFPVVPPAPGSEAAGCAGLRMKWTLYTELDNVWSRENIIGFASGGAVQTHYNKTWAFRSTPKAASAPNPDYWIGYFWDGYADISLPAGNASIYLTDCNASLGGVIGAHGASPITSDGFFVDGPCSDFWAFRCETLVTQRGFSFVGIGSGGTSTQRRDGHIDVHIDDCHVDQFSDRGFYFRNMPVGTIIVVDGETYAAPGGSGPIACYEVRDSAGVIKISGEAICSSVPNTIGLYVYNSSGVVSDVIVAQSQRPIALDAASDCRIVPTINVCEEATLAPTQGAVWMSNSTRNQLIAPLVKSTATTNSKLYPYGIQLIGTGNTYNELNVSGINPASLASGGSKLIINGSVVSSTGLTSTNLVSGIIL